MKIQDIAKQIALKPNEQLKGLKERYLAWENSLPIVENEMVEVQPVNTAIQPDNIIPVDVSRDSQTFVKEDVPVQPNLNVQSNGDNILSQTNADIIASEPVISEPINTETTVVQSDSKDLLTMIDDMQKEFLAFYVQMDNMCETLKESVNKNMSIQKAPQQQSHPVVNQVAQEISEVNSAASLVAPFSDVNMFEQSASTNIFDNPGAGKTL
jgi:hypothetical protein